MSKIDLSEWDQIDAGWYYRVVDESLEVHVAPSGKDGFEVSVKNNGLNEKVPDYYQEFETAIEEGNKLVAKLLTATEGAPEEEVASRPRMR